MSVKSHGFLSIHHCPVFGIFSVSKKIGRKEALSSGKHYTMTAKTPYPSQPYVSVCIVFQNAITATRHVAQSNPDSTKGNFRTTGASSAIPHWKKGDQLSLVFEVSSVRVTLWNQADKQAQTHSECLCRQTKEAKLSGDRLSITHDQQSFLVTMIAGANSAFYSKRLKNTHQQENCDSFYQL